MSTTTTQPLSLLHVDFDELYARHLGRHSQFGINVAHVLALYGLWFGVYAAMDQAARHLGVPTTWPILAAMAAAYLAVVGLNAPLRVSSRRRPSWPSSSRACSQCQRCRPGRSPGSSRWSRLLQVPILEPQDLDLCRGHVRVQPAVPARPRPEPHPARLRDPDLPQLPALPPGGLAALIDYRLRPRATTMLCRSSTGKARRSSTQRFKGPALCSPIDSMSGVSQPPR